MQDGRDRFMYFLHGLEPTADSSVSFIFASLHVVELSDLVAQTWIIEVKDFYVASLTLSWCIDKVLITLSWV